MVARLALVALIVAAGVATWKVVHPVESGPSLQATADDLASTGVPAVLLRLRDGAQVDAFARGGAPADSRFRVGSVTKTFVAALTLVLADEGAISLDDTVAQHLPGLLSDGERIAVSDLVAHTAGLFDYTFEARLRNGELAPDALIAVANARERTSGYAYSSTNYLVLGLVLEAATGERIGTLLRRHVFEPFGLRETTFDPGRVGGRYLHGHERSSRDGVATGHLRDTDERSARSAWAAGAIVSTTADLDRFFVRLLRSDLGRRMRPPGGRPVRPRSRAVDDRLRNRARSHRKPARDDHGRRRPRRAAPRPGRKRLPVDPSAGDGAPARARPRPLWVEPCCHDSRL